jgi:hypothetical protein
MDQIVRGYVITTKAPVFSVNTFSANHYLYIWISLEVYSGWTQYIFYRFIPTKEQFARIATLIVRVHAA